jgi:hypothetical protein
MVKQEIHRLGQQEVGQCRQEPGSPEEGLKHNRFAGAVMLVENQSYKSSRSNEFPSTHCKTYSKLPGAESPLKDAEVVDEQAAAEGVLQIQTDQPAAGPPPHLRFERKKGFLLIG